MKTFVRSVPVDFAAAFTNATLAFQLIIARFQLRLVAASRRRATMELIDASAARLAAQDMYDGRIQCLDTRQEQLLEQIVAIRESLQREQAPQPVTRVVRVNLKAGLDKWEADLRQRQADSLVENEIDALHRIAAFSGHHCVAEMDETPSFYTIEVDHAEDILTARVDFFLQYQCKKPLLTPTEQEIFDDMMFMPMSSDDLALQLTVQPATKESFQALHCAVRMLLAGARVSTLSEPMDRQTFLCRLQSAIEWNCTLAPLQLDFTPSRTTNH